MRLFNDEIFCVTLQDQGYLHDCYDEYDEYVHIQSFLYDSLPACLDEWLVQFCFFSFYILSKISLSHVSLGIRQCPYQQLEKVVIAIVLYQ